jgi:hypothetical protein
MATGYGFSDDLLLQCGHHLVGENLQATLHLLRGNLAAGVELTQHSERRCRHGPSRANHGAGKQLQ